MKRPPRRLLVVIFTAGAATWWYCYPPATSVLSFCIGQHFEEVVRKSSFPVLEHSNRPADDPGQDGIGDTWVTEPAVILRFDDPRHGFTLPPTKFAVLGFEDHKAVTLSTSPMLETLRFDDALAVLEQLQNQFKAGGWEPRAGDDNAWFDLSPQGKKRLYARMFEPGYMRSIELRVPKKYEMIFRIWCTEGCATREPPYLFMIDVGVGEDLDSWFDGSGLKKSAPEGALFRDASRAEINPPTSAHSGTSAPTANSHPSHPDARTSSPSAPRAQRAASSP
jgi:hypothetical protein